jgi:PAS domain S-box-containing protein
MSGVPRVLLVEDNPITRKLVRFALQNEAIELIEATDAATAIATIETQRPDLILQDLLLPDMDGFELANRLRAIPSIQNVPILAFSGLLTQLDEKRIAGSAFTDFVTKPIEPSRLIRIVRAHLPSVDDTPVTSFGGQRRVVLADDDDVQRKLSVFRLSRLGFDVVDVADGHAALEAARASRPSAIVTDAMMPGLDGFGLCAAIRQDESLKDLPIVLVTSTYVDDADREFGRLAGANAFVIRTPDLKEMISALDTVLGASPSSAMPVTVQPPEFERERASRTMVQLERQAAAASNARQQCALLSAELAVLNAISEAITQDTDIELVLRDILAACCDAGGVSIGALYLRTEDGGLRTIMVGGLPGHERTISEPISGGEVLGALIDGGRARSISRCSATDAEGAWLTANRLESAIIVPLQHKGRELGALVMMSELADLGLDDRLVFAEAVGHQVSVALTLTRAFEDSETAARVAREHANLLGSVFTSISDPIVVVDAAGHATTWNQAASALIGADALLHQDRPYPDWAQHIGMFHNDRVTPFETDERPVARALTGENVERVEAYLTFPGKQDGAWVSVGARPLRDEHGAVRGAVAVSRDVTAERMAHEQLMISDRMASIGMMAAGVGHEINNPLSAVVANLEMATAEVTSLVDRIGAESLGELPDVIREACEAAQRVRQIAMDLKVFSGGQGDTNSPINVEEVLDSSVRMAWNQVRQRAKVVRKYGHVPLACGAESRLGQVFLNLIVNAAQAIPEGQAADNEIRLATRVDDHGRIVVDIEDTGSGIAPHVMQRLFTPFVTTKPVGVGTGLGLSICQRLVGAMGGAIWADSTPGVGTVFHVALPAASPAEVTAPKAAACSEPAPLARSRVLVVDDEDMIGMMLRRVLKAHDVTVVTNARDALALIVEGARFDAILCDLMMPVMTGIEFHQALSLGFPDQARALMFLTGGAFSRETAAFLESLPNTQLTKPFDVVKLRAEVDAHLIARRASGRPPGQAA